jgi:MinD superfamily P-loop ATPase
MKAIGIVSGKGGVGKTSITASLACLFEENGYKIVAADTDVDAPNLAILFHAISGDKGDVSGNRINSQNTKKFTVQTTEKASLSPELCIHCKKCITDNYCTFGALSWNEEKMIPIIDNIACEGCNACKWLCHEKAFNINPVDSGTIEILESIYNFPVITGETILGAQTSGKLVTELKKYAKEILIKEKRELLIVDGPPGIGCPVIAALGDLNYVIVVMEPTQAALHDADRVIQVINNFNIPFGVILNKSDIWAEGRTNIIEYLKKNSIKLLGEIKLDSKWPRVVAKGVPIVKEIPDGISSQAIKQIYLKISEIVSNL